ncbi:MAG: hypothetical protein AB7K09_05400 [Planctomycetota bacterium]
MTQRITRIAIVALAALACTTARPLAAQDGDPPALQLPDSCLGKWTIDAEHTIAARGEPKGYNAEELAEWKRRMRTAMAGATVQIESSRLTTTIGLREKRQWLSVTAINGNTITLSVSDAEGNLTDGSLKIVDARTMVFDCGGAIWLHRATTLNPDLVIARLVGVWMFDAAGLVRALPESAGRTDAELADEIEATRQINSRTAAIRHEFTYNEYGRYTAGGRQITAAYRVVEADESKATIRLTPRAGGDESELTIVFDARNPDAMVMTPAGGGAIAAMYLMREPAPAGGKGDKLVPTWGLWSYDASASVRGSKEHKDKSESQLSAIIEAEIKATSAMRFVFNPDEEGARLIVTLAGQKFSEGLLKVVSADGSVMKVQLILPDGTKRPATLTLADDRAVLDFEDGKTMHLQRLGK